MDKKILALKIHLLSFLIFFSSEKLIANPLTEVIIAVSICTGLIVCPVCCMKCSSLETCGYYRQPLSSLRVTEKQPEESDHLLQKNSRTLRRSGSKELNETSFRDES